MLYVGGRRQKNLESAAPKKHPKSNPRNASQPSTSNVTHEMAHDRGTHLLQHFSCKRSLQTFSPPQPAPATTCTGACACACACWFLLGVNVSIQPSYLQPQISTPPWPKYFTLHPNLAAAGGDTTHLLLTLLGVDASWPTPQWNLKPKLMKKFLYRGKGIFAFRLVFFVKQFLYLVRKFA